jgi:hypothetical protein
MEIEINRISAPPERCISVVADIHLFAKLRIFTREFLYPCP